MRRILLVIGILLALVVGFTGAEFAFPQMTEFVLKLSCPMTKPDANCQARMVAMGHVWSLRDNLDRAAAWYARAAEAGSPAGMFHLAWSYEHLGYRRIEAALRALDDSDERQASAEGEDQSVRHAVGDKFQLAKQWYRKAADMNFAPAMNNLGEMSLEGRAGPRDLKAAFDWHLAAARAGNPVAAMSVSLAYRIGQGVEIDPGEAERWSRFLPQEGSPDVGMLTLARTTMNGLQIDRRERAVIIASAKQHLPVSIGFQPLKPDPRLPTFHEVQQQLPSASAR